jgi:hypothetical protein
MNLVTFWAMSTLIHELYQLMLTDDKRDTSVAPVIQSDESERLV